MLEKILYLTKKLIPLQTTSENPQALETALKLITKELSGYTIEQFESNGYKSILVHNQTSRPKKFRIILNGHLDIIPGKPDQYIPVVKENKLYGAGSMDMKANVACLVYVFKNIAKSLDYPIGLQIVTDEEIGGFNGTKYQITQGINADFVIAAETTQFNIVNQAKGILWANIQTTGKSAHGAYPWNGDNALWKVSEFLNKLSHTFEFPKTQKWLTTVNLSQISTTNTAYNKIPDTADIKLDIRYIPSETKSTLKKLKNILPKKSHLEIIANEPALYTDENNFDLKLLKTITKRITGQPVTCYKAQGSSDARHYMVVNCPGIEFGPIGGGIGSDQEWINIPSLEKYYQILISYLESINTH